MPARFVNIDHDTPLLLPQNIRDWVPHDHLAHYILDAVDELGLSQVRVNHRGTGSEQYPPRMMLALLIYGYATGTLSSRQIERATHENVAVRMICADTHPDHDTICTFRRENKALLTESFVRVLQMAQRLKFLKVGQITVSVDGTKVLANASKHAAVSYQRAGEQIEWLEAEVGQLLAKAEQADSTPLEEGLSIPEEIARRQERKAALAKARAAARFASEQVEYERKRAERAARQERGERVGGGPPQPPSPEPEPKEQYNFTDPPSRIMKVGSGQHFEPCYNAQAAVEVDSRLIVAERISDAPNDKQQLTADLKAMPVEVGPVGAVLTDNGFYSEAAVVAVEQTAQGQPTGVTVYAAVEKTGHHRRVADLEQRAEPALPAGGASVGEVMRYRLRTKAGRALYKLRQQTVEPVFGIIKEAMGFRQFLLRGMEKAGLEWTLVCLAYNFKRLHRLTAAA